MPQAARAEPITLAAEISREAEAETGMLSAGATRASTVPAHAPAAAVAPPVWDLVVAAEDLVEAVEADADEQGIQEH